MLENILLGTGQNQTPTIGENCSKYMGATPPNFRGGGELKLLDQNNWGGGT